MKAAVLRTFGRFDIEEVDLDRPRPDELRIRTLASGLCHTDYHIMTGAMPIPLPAVPGHEAAGIVEAVGDAVRGFAPGDMVVTCASAYCGECRECQTGHNHRCDAPPARPDSQSDARIRSKGEPLYQLARLGAFAEEMLVHQRSVVKLPEGVPPTVGALLGCAVLTGVGAVLNGAKVEPGATVVVIGCGGVGLNVVQGARIAGAERVIAVDLQPAKLELARRFGATDVISAGPDSVAEVQELTRGGADYAFDVVGLSSTMRDACLMLRKGGTAVLVGAASVDAQLPVPVAPLLFKEIRLIGSLMGSSPFQLFLPQLGALYRNGSLKLDELVSETIPLSEINNGYARMAKSEATRIVMTF